jgi:phage baseplate assembly protein W
MMQRFRLLYSSPWTDLKLQSINNFMPTFIGFNTINQFKKFTLTDFALVKRDLANALNIQQGEIPGKPGYGTTIWSYVFENQTPETIAALLAELQRVAGGDPRVYISDAQVFPQDNGLLIELEIRVVPSSTAERLSIFFDQETRRASYI